MEKTEDQLNREDVRWVRGNRAAWVRMLQTCIKELGYEDAEVDHARWIPERESAIAQLRSLCEDFGDNDWEENLNLGDVIEKHLGDHLFSQRDSDTYDARERDI